MFLSRKIIKGFKKTDRFVDVIFWAIVVSFIDLHIFKFYTNPLFYHKINVFD